MRVALLSVVLLIALQNDRAAAQSVESLPVGVQVRVSGDRATNEGIRYFALRGALLSSDSSRIEIRHDRSGLALVDTIALAGVRRLQMLAGIRPRGRRMAIGSATAGLLALTGWLLARQALERESYDVIIVGPQPVTTRVTGDRPALVGQLRVAIPIAVIAGGLIGSAIGREKWVRVSVPRSEYPEAR